MAEPLQRAVEAALREATPAPLALMRLIMAAGSASDLQSALAQNGAARRERGRGGAMGGFGAMRKAAGAPMAAMSLEAATGLPSAECMD